jgi:hypothetical protein
MLRPLRRITPYAHARSKETPHRRILWGVRIQFPPGDVCKGGERGSLWNGLRGALLVYGFVASTTGGFVSLVPSRGPKVLVVSRLEPPASCSVVD